MSDEKERQEIADLLGVPLEQIHKLDIPPSGHKGSATAPKKIVIGATDDGFEYANVPESAPPVETPTFFNDPIAAKITRRISEAAEKLMAGETQETTMPTPEQLENRFMSDVLRHVVCDCGNYRHHGVHWMPDGSGEGKKEALELMRNYFANAV